MVEAFTVDGKITLDTTDFKTKIGDVTTKLNDLTTAFNKPIDTSAFVNSFQGIKGEFNSLKEMAKEINTLFKTIIDVPKIIEDLTKVKAEIEMLKEKVAKVKTEATGVSNEMDKVVEKTVNWKEVLATVSPNFQNMVTSLEMINAEEQKMVTELGKIGSEIVEQGSQIKTNTTYYEEWVNVSKQFKNAQQGLIRGFVEQGEAIELANALEQQRLNTLREEMNLANRLGSAYMNVAREQNRQLTYEREMLMVEEQFATVIGDEIASKFQFNNILQESATLEKEILALMGDETTMLGEEIAEETKKLNTLRQELDLNKELTAIEKEKIGLISEENALINEQSALNRKNVPKGNQLDSMSYLPRRIGSMALTMWGFNELMDVYDKTMGHINAESQKDYFAKRMGMDAKATDDFTKSLERMQNGWTDATGKFHKGYQKLDMTVVGANALETASKYKVQQDSLGDLTEVMAIYGSEFVKQGRSQEDSILAVNDALDGELRRLKEVGIGKEELEATGLWNGDESDKSGMLKALLQIAEERGYDQTAKDITNLSDAITTLEVKLSIDLARAFGIVEPLLRDVMSNFVTMLEVIEQLCTWIGKFATDFAKMTGLMDENGKGTKLGNFLETWASWFITLGITALGLYKILKPLLGMFGKLKDIGGGIGKGAEDVATTGGTVAKDIEKGGFKSEFKKLGRNLGIMARVFIEVAIGLVMAWALMEEAMILIARIGDDYEKMKPSFDKGAKFLKEYGIYILAVGGAMAVLLQYTDKLPQTDWKSQAKAFGKLMIGLAEAMVLIGEAIALLIIPLGAIALLGWMSDQLDPNMIQKGNEVIGMYADALDYIASNDNIGYFIIGLTVASAILGFTADTVGVVMAVGIATALLLVSEAIVMLIAPLKAVEMLGDMASDLDEDAINKGAEAIGTIGRILQTLAPVVGDLVAVDWGVFSDQLINVGNKILNGGKDGLTTLVEDIIPSLNDFVTKFNQIEFSDTGLNADSVAKITQTANAIAPMISAVNNLTSLLGGDTSISFMGIKIETNTGIRGKLDQLYEDVSAVMDFANKLGNLKTTDQVGTTAITQTSDAISQLKAKLDQFVNTISSYSDKVHTASDRLGKSLPNGFKSGASTFSATVVTVLASGISEVQARYPTMNNGGKALGQKLVDGFKNHKPSLKTITSREISYALTELDNAKDDFYTKGKALGSELTRGYEDGADIHSPGLIARTTARELRYTMDALDVGKQMMYRGGVALGQALTNGYDSTGNLRTDVGVLASKGVNSEQLQANATNVQANTKGKGKTQESLTPTINIDMSNSTIIGIQDLNTRIQNAVETAIVKMNSPNGATGY